MERRTEHKTKPRLPTGLDLTFPPPADESYWESTYTYLILRPGSGSPEKLTEKPSMTPADGTRSLGLLNQLGAEGWELVSDVTSSSTVSTFWGWPSASSLPIRREWTLKRPVG